MLRISPAQGGNAGEKFRPEGGNGAENRHEILEDRYKERATIFASQLPPTKWHEYLGDPTLADAICDRLLHNAHRIVLKGPSRRKEESTTNS